MRPDIILATVNSKWIHPSLALRLLKANLGPLEERCEIIEFALRQPLQEKVTQILKARPRILGLSVSIWNHLATLELLEALDRKWNGFSSFLPRTKAQRHKGNEKRKKNPGVSNYLAQPNSISQRDAFKPVIILGGPEVSWLPPDAGIFRYADFIVRGEGEHAFRRICEGILAGEDTGNKNSLQKENCFHGQSGNVQEENNCLHRQSSNVQEQVDINEIKTAYHLYSDEDLRRKLIYVESSRGCPFNCEFCSSCGTKVRYFPLDQFLAEMDTLIERGVGTFKFLDRTFNLDIDRAVKIMKFFLERIEKRSGVSHNPLVVHFEMVPSNFPQQLLETLSRFPPGSLRLEIGIQTLNTEVSQRICRPSNPEGNLALRARRRVPEKELKVLRYLREKTNAIIHADLIAGLPGEDIVSFGSGFDRLWAALSGREDAHTGTVHPRVEIQLGILKLLPGAPIARHSETFAMRYNSLPPYEVMETAALPEHDLQRIKNFARFWELIVNRGLLDFDALEVPVFDNFMTLADSLLVRFGRNWGIDKRELLEELKRKRHRSD